MKRCPQCGAEYDDYVQYCFVDGVELAEPASVAPVAAPAPAPIPAHPPGVGGGHAPAHAAAPHAVDGPARPPVPPPKVAPLVGLPTRTPRPAPSADAPARPVPVWALLMVLMMLIAAFGFVSLAGALLLIGGGTDDDEPQTVAAAPRPAAAPGPTAPVPPLQPRPASASTEVLQVEFESDPPGATIYEGEQQLCNTPCRVPQPDYAPPERTFVLKLEGYPDATYTMTDPTQVQQVKLGNGSSRPRPRRNNGDTEDLLIRR